MISKVNHPKKPEIATRIAVKIKPIQWKPQFSRNIRPRASDGEYGYVNGDQLFFIYQSSDPYCKGWHSWRRWKWTGTTIPPAPTDAKIRYRTHWNVWTYFGGNEQQQIGVLKSRHQAKRTARLLLLKKIRAMIVNS